MITEKDWIKYFPHDEPRPQQVEAINFILNAFTTHKYAIINAPTGSGKSAIAITVARYIEHNKFNNSFKTTYITTTQKILQVQYIRDFPFLSNISAKSNYTCPHKFGMSCEFGLLTARAMKDQAKIKEYQQKCIYNVARNKFLQSEYGLTNTPFLLNTIHHNDIEPRNLLVVDECHNLEQNIIDLVSMRFTKYMATEQLHIDWIDNVYNTTMNNVVKWVNDIYLPVMKQRFLDSDEKLKKNGDNKEYLESPQGLAFLKRHTALEREVGSIESCISFYNENEWAMTVSPTGDIVTLSPIYASRFTDKALFHKAERVLLMSGTINEKILCDTLGINSDDAKSLAMESMFPPENRIIYNIGVGSMSKSNINTTLPALTEMVEALLDEYKDFKGLIHTNTYKTAQYLINNIKSDRLLLHDSDDRIEVLKFHSTTTNPTVLVSPSFTEGIDLVGELSRFQILCKIPYPYLGDNYIRTKMDKVENWYAWETAKTIMQALGRSIRSDTDFATSYILDSDWDMFFNRYKWMFPKWFIDSIKTL